MTISAGGGMGGIGGIPPAPPCRVRVNDPSSFTVYVPASFTVVLIGLTVLPAFEQNEALCGVAFECHHHTSDVEAIVRRRFSVPRTADADRRLAVLFRREQLAQVFDRHRRYDYNAETDIVFRVMGARVGF